MTKTKLTEITARKFQFGDGEAKQFAAHVVEDGKAISPAAQCKRIMESEASVRSLVKREKREAGKKIKKHVCWVRKNDEQLSAMKFQPPKSFTKHKEGIMSMYNVYVCWEMGMEQVGYRRIPCHCVACRNQLNLQWKNGLSFSEQPRFQPVKDCKYRNYLDGENGWHFFRLQQRTQKDGNHHAFMDEEADLFRSSLRDLIGEQMSAAVEEGGFAAIVCNDTKEKHGYYIVQWSGSPWTHQETGELMCDGVHFNHVPRAPLWYTKSFPVEADTHVLKHVIVPDLKLLPISEGNPLPSSCSKKSATTLRAMKLSEETHDFIMEEILRREALEDCGVDAISAEESSECSSSSE